MMMFRLYKGIKGDEIILFNAVKNVVLFLN